MSVTLNGTNGVTFPDTGVFTNAVGTTTTNGYQKLPNGLILQWGTGTAVAGGNSTVTFPIAFPTACLMVNGTPFYGTTGNQCNCTLISSSTTQAVFYVFCYSNGGLAVAPKWIAIGY